MVVNVVHDGRTVARERDIAGSLSAVLVWHTLLHFPVMSGRYCMPPGTARLYMTSDIETLATSMLA